MDMSFWGSRHGHGRMGWWGEHGRGFGRHGGRRLRRGILKVALLKLLAEMPRHGYDLIREVRQKGWGGGAGSVYPILAALQAAGLIEGRDEGQRRTYDITEKGRQVLGEHAAEFERFLAEDEGLEEAGDDVAAQLRDSAGRLMQAVGQLGPSSKTETIERVRELLDGVRKEIYKALAEE